MNYWGFVQYATEPVPVSFPDYTFTENNNHRLFHWRFDRSGEGNLLIIVLSKNNWWNSKIEIRRQCQCRGYPIEVSVVKRSDDLVNINKEISISLEFQPAVTYQDGEHLWSLPYNLLY